MTLERATIYDVADRAGVSISTVSNVLNKPDKVSAGTRTRVLAAADELGFVPRPQATSLARRQANRIGVMAPFSSYSSYLRRLSGVLRLARDLELDVVAFDHESAAQASSPVLASMPIHGRLDGLIVMGLEIEPGIAQRLSDRGLPTVAVDADSSTFSRVVIDDLAGGALAARHLIERGHRRFGYLTERQVSEYDSQAVRRQRGFSTAIESVPDRSLTTRTCDNSIEAARATARELIAGEDRPTAVMAHHDDLAVGVLLAAKDLGLRVPQDIAVMGFDDGPSAAAADLSTVRQPFEESGAAALRILLDQVAGTGPRTTTLLESTLVVRATT